jgi:uncharacterized protein YqeY
MAGIKLAEIERQQELAEPEVLAVVQKEIKARREAIAEAEQAKRPELITARQAEIAILEAFLPQALSAAELALLVQETLHETGATSLNDMGKVMNAIMPKVRGRADGKEVNQQVREALEGK